MVPVRDLHLTRHHDPQRRFGNLEGVPGIERNMDRPRTLSTLRKHDIIAVEEVNYMPFELDITGSAICNTGQVQRLAGGKAEGARHLPARSLEVRLGPLTPANQKGLFRNQ